MYMPDQPPYKQAVDRKSPIPLYFQLKQILHRGILQGVYQKAQQLPSERELQNIYGLSRMTIRRALSELVNDGFLIRQPGRGSFVTRPRLQDRVGRLTSFSEDMQLRGLDSHSKILAVRLVTDEDVAFQMGINAGEELVKLERVRLVEGEPMALQTAFLRHRYCPGLTDAALLGGSLYETLEERYGLYIARAEQTWEARPAKAREAELLQIEQGLPVLRLERLTFLADGAPVEYVRSTYRGDRYRFTAEMRR